MRSPAMRSCFAVVLIGVFVLAAGRSLSAQESATPVVGWLNPQPLEPSRWLFDGFRDGLSDGGFVDGKNVKLELRPADGKRERLPGLAADLVRLGRFSDNGRVSPCRARRPTRNQIHPDCVHFRRGPSEDRTSLKLHSAGRERYRHSYPVQSSGGEKTCPCCMSWFLRSGALLS